MTETEFLKENKMANYDVIVIGAGPGGYVCAIRCAQLGHEQQPARHNQPQ